MRSIPKTYSFNLFLTKSLRIFFLMETLIFVEVFFYFSLGIVFWTYMESKAVVTLHFVDPAVTNYFFF